MAWIVAITDGHDRRFSTFEPPAFGKLAVPCQRGSGRTRESLGSTSRTSGSGTPWTAARATLTSLRSGRDLLGFRQGFLRAVSNCSTSPRQPRIKSFSSVRRDPLASSRQVGSSSSSKTVSSLRNRPAAACHFVWCGELGLTSSTRGIISSVCLATSPSWRRLDSISSDRITPPGGALALATEPRWGSGKTIGGRGGVPVATGGKSTGIGVRLRPPAALTAAPISPGPPWAALTASCISDRPLEDACIGRPGRGSPMTERIPLRRWSLQGGQWARGAIMM